MAGTARKTLGTLIGDLLGSYVVADENSISVDNEASSLDDVGSMRIRINLGLSAVDFARTERDLKELVQLRNTLVHHFIDQHDLWSMDGCHDAQDALIAAYSRIDQHFELLRGWAEKMEQSQRLASEFARSEAFRDLVVNGIALDGTVNWSDAGIVRALREAAAELAVDGWVSITHAATWIAERHPEQLPAKYGCSSWRQVVHESRIFELRYFEANGLRSASYREKKSSVNSR
tara:strand:+ start:210 stop:908 length:699 start_codon:yes stop_codon:yes gene_type:complete